MACFIYQRARSCCSGPFVHPVFGFLIGTFCDIYPSVIDVAGQGLRMQVLTCAVHKKVYTCLLCEPALNLLRKKQTTTANAK